MSSRSKVLLENFIRRLSGADKPKNLPQAVLEKNEIQAFYTLALAYNEYLQKDFSKAEHNIRDKLLLIQNTVQDFKSGNYVSAGELKTAHKQLEKLVDKHFSLPLEDQKKNYSSFQSTAKAICKNHKKAIESNALLQKVFYNLLNAIAGLVIFYGIYLVATYRSRDSFFPEPAPDPYAQESMSLLDSLSTSISDSDDEVTDDSVEKGRLKVE